MDDDALKKVVAQRLRLLRSEMDLNLTEIAEKLSNYPKEINFSRYSNWEQGTRFPPPDILLRIAEFHKVSTDWLYGRTEIRGFNANNSAYINTGRPMILVNGTPHQIEKVPDTVGYTLRYMRGRGLEENKSTSFFAADNSMAKIINQGDEVLVDCNTTEVKDRDVFALLIGEAVWFRWIRMDIDGEYVISCEDDKNYPDKKLSAEGLKKLNIIGRVARINQDR